MTARILVVDDHLPNIKLLEARLTAEYYDVLTATNGPDALAICAQGQCDIILLDVMMPGMDGFEVCRRLKSDIHTAHLPVILVTALDQPSDRVRGLEAGADDFLTKPVDEIALVARVRSLARLKVVLDDARNRALTSAALAGTDPLTEAMKEQGLDGRILVIDDRGSSSERVVAALRQGYEIEVQPSPQAGLTLASWPDEPARRPYEVAMACWQNGFYVRYGGDTLQLAPPFVSQRQEIDALVNALGEALNAVP